MCSDDSTDQTIRTIRNVESHTELFPLRQPAGATKALHVAGFIVLWDADGSMEMRAETRAGAENSHKKARKYAKNKSLREVEI
jgi:hypothetical protein